MFYYEVFRESIKTYYSLIHQFLYDNTPNKENYEINEEKMEMILKIICRLIFSLLLLGKNEKNITRDIPSIYRDYKKESSEENNISFEK
ncbi:MAG: hypothetical protein ACRCXQ_02710 [Vagococcus fluvialis]